MFHAFITGLPCWVNNEVVEKFPNLPREASPSSQRGQIRQSLPQGTLDPGRICQKRLGYPEHASGGQKRARRNPDIGV